MHKQVNKKTAFFSQKDRNDKTIRVSIIRLCNPKKKFKVQQYLLDKLC